MSERILKTVAVLAGLLTIGMAVIGALLRIFGPASTQTFNIGSPIDFFAEALAASTYGFIGTLLAQRLPKHPVPWIFLGIGLSFAGVVLTWAYAVVALSQAPELPLAREGLLLDTAVMQPFGIALLICLLVVFPDGHTFDRASRWVLRLIPFTAALISIGVVLTPESIGIFTGVKNPLNPGLPPEVGRALTVAGAVATVLLGAIACRSLLGRYRAVGDVQREQIRWFVWAGALAVVLAGGVLVLLAAFPNILNTPAEAIVLILFSIGGAVVPIACAVAIRRYRLYDIDRLISQTFVYTCLIAIVAGVYSALITAFERISIAITGEGSDFSVVITTLVLAVAFEPAKKRLEAFAERFRDEPVRVAGPVAPDDAWIEAIAVRVADLLSDRRQSPERADRPPHTPAPDPATSDRQPSPEPVSSASEPQQSEQPSP
jgi:hypothetical protein